MKKAVVFVVSFLVCCVLTLAFYKYSSASSLNAWSLKYPPKGRKVLLLGDELGAQSQDSKAAVSAYEFIDLSQKGQKLVDLSPEQLEALLKEHKPDVVMLSGSIHDLAAGSPWQKIWDHFERLVQKTQEQELAMLFVAVRPPSMDNFSFAFRDISKRYGTALVEDSLDGLWKSDLMESMPLLDNAELRERVAKNNSFALSKLY